MLSQTFRYPGLRSIALGWAVAAMLMVMSAAAKAETLTIGGSSAGLGTLHVLAMGFAKIAPGVTVALVPNLGSSGGIKALAAGVVDLAVISHRLTPEEVAQGLVGVEYGKTPFGIVTGMPGTSGFELAELAEVYAGQRQAWPDGTPIRLVMFPKNGTDSLQLEAFSPAVKKAVQTALARPGVLVRSSDAAAADAIESIPGSLGTSTLALISSEGRKLRMMPINGVVPSGKTIADGTYPYIKSMSVVHKAAPSATVGRFLAYIASPQGRQILVNSGHWVASAS